MNETRESRSGKRGEGRRGTREGRPRNKCCLSWQGTGEGGERDEPEEAWRGTASAEKVNRTGNGTGNGERQRDERCTLHRGRNETKWNERNANAEHNFNKGTRERHAGMIATALSTEWRSKSETMLPALKKGKQICLKYFLCHLFRLLFFSFLICMYTAKNSCNV